jgi:hypothetical protein
MSFPAYPVDGQQINVNNINYVYSAGNNAWTRAALDTIRAQSFTYYTGENPGYTYLLDDISLLFDGVTTSFTLSYDNGTPFSPNNPSQLTIVIGNNNVWPNRYATVDYQNLPEIPLFTQGFAVSGSTIRFATAPLKGMGFFGTARTNSDGMPTWKYKSTPIPALNIMLGA